MSSRIDRGAAGCSPSGRMSDGSGVPRAPASTAAVRRPPPGVRSWRPMDHRRAITPEAEAAIRDAIAALGRLPVLDRTVQLVASLAEDPETTNQDLVVALEGDPNLAIDVLRFANSAACARPVRAKTLRQAVALIGRRALAQLVVETAVASFFDRAPGGSGAVRGQHHAHALQVAACSAGLADRLHCDVRLAHLAGLLHDVGKLVLPVAFGEAAMDEVTALAPSGPERVALERDRLGIDHAYVGELLVRDAGLDELADAVGAHHGGRYGEWCPSLEAACVQAAEAAVALSAGASADGALLASAMTRLGIDAAGLEAIVLEALPRSDPRGRDELAERVAALERQAAQDDLTGLLSRRAWTARANAALAAGPATVLIVDVDRFKSVNDRHGHATGDLVLTEVARVLARHGQAGRLGGDEFAVLVGPERPMRLEAEAIVGGVRAAFASDLAVTVSVGASCAEEPGGDLAVMLRTADEALYAAKAQGRDRAAFGVAA